MESAGHVDVIVQLIPSDQSVWYAPTSTTGEHFLQLKGTQEQYKVSRIFEGASCKEIFDGAVREQLAYATCGTNITILAVGYTEFISLAHRTLRAIVSAPEASERYMAATAVEVTPNESVKGIFHAKNVPTISMWENDKGLCIGNTPYHTLMCPADVDAFFSVPMYSSSMTAIVAEVFQTSPSDSATTTSGKRMLRSTVTMLYIPSAGKGTGDKKTGASTSLEHSFWSALQQETESSSQSSVPITLGERDDATAKAPFRTLMHHVVTNGGAITAVLPLCTDPQALPETLTKLRRVSLLQQLRTFPYQQYYHFPALITDAVDAYRRTVDSGSQQLREVQWHGAYKGWEAVLEGAARYQRDLEYRLSAAANGAMESVVRKWQPRFDAALHRKKEALRAKEHAEEELILAKNKLQEDWNASSSASVTFKSKLEYRRNLQQQIEAEKKAYGQSQTVLRGKERELSEFQTLRDEKLAKLDEDIQRVKSTVTQHLAEEAELLSQLRHEAEEHEATRSRDYTAIYSAKLDARNTYFAQQAELDVAMNATHTHPSAFDPKEYEALRTRAMELQVQSVQKEREIQSLRERIDFLRGGTAANPPQSTHSDHPPSLNLENISLLHGDLSTLIQEPPTSRNQRRARANEDQTMSSFTHNASFGTEARGNRTEDGTENERKDEADALVHEMSTAELIRSPVRSPFHKLMQAAAEEAAARHHGHHHHHPVSGGAPTGPRTSPQQNRSVKRSRSNLQLNSSLHSVTSQGSFRSVTPTPPVGTDSPRKKSPLHHSSIPSKSQNSNSGVFSATKSNVSVSSGHSKTRTAGNSFKGSRSVREEEYAHLEREGTAEYVNSTNKENQPAKISRVVSRVHKRVDSVESPSKEGTTSPCGIWARRQRENAEKRPSAFRAERLVQKELFPEALLSYTRNNPHSASTTRRRH